MCTSSISVFQEINKERWSHMLIERPTSRKIYAIMCKKDHISHTNDDKKNTVNSTLNFYG